MPGEKILIVTTGGGNDILSGTLIANSLPIERTIDIAGVLSPGAMHMYDGTPENAINNVRGEIRRFIAGKTPIEIPFIDKEVVKLSREYGLPIRDFYNFSLRFGSGELQTKIHQLIEREKYGLVIGVDVGGDILARNGTRDPTVLSPAMDHAILRMLGNLKVPSILVEFGLGTDGELRPEGIEEILAEMEKENVLCQKDTIDKNAHYVETYRKMFEKISQTRSGNTVPNTLKTLEANTDIIARFDGRVTINDKEKMLFPFDVRLPKEHFGKMYTFEPKKLATLRQETAWEFDNLLEQHIRIKNRHPQWRTEMDFTYLWSGNNWKTATIGDGKCLYLLTPSNRITGEQRQQLVQKCFEQYASGNADVVVMYKNDLDYVKTDGHFISYPTFAGQFVVLSVDNYFGKKVSADINMYSSIRLERRDSSAKPSP